jgi:hypothetical protein
MRNLSRHSVAIILIGIAIMYSPVIEGIDQKLNWVKNNSEKALSMLIFWN